MSYVLNSYLLTYLLTKSTELLTGYGKAPVYNIQWWHHPFESEDRNKFTNRVSKNIFDCHHAECVDNKNRESLTGVYRRSVFTVYSHRKKLSRLVER